MLRLKLSERVADYATQVIAARSIDASGFDPFNVLSLLSSDTKSIQSNFRE
jgi:hypothetical protein